MDLAPGPEVYEAAREVAEQLHRKWLYVANRNAYIRDWMILAAKDAAVLAYRAGREEAARDIEAAAPEPLINISGRSSKPTADEAVWFARLMAYGHAASIARGGSDG